MKYDIIVFDTAPTGHTLRLLNFPNLLEKGLEKAVMLKEKFGPLLASLGPMMGAGNGNDTFNNLFGNLEKMKKTVETVNK